VIGKLDGFDLAGTFFIDLENLEIQHIFDHRQFNEHGHFDF
jgi:hypothetical protein